MAAMQVDSTHIQDVETILASRDDEIPFVGVRKRREAVLITEVERRRAALVDERTSRLVAQGEWAQARARFNARQQLRDESLLPPE